MTVRAKVEPQISPSAAAATIAGPSGPLRNDCMSDRGYVARVAA
jgi:hypothetical protein